MGYDPRIHHRRSTRLSTWDYRGSGAYFVTIVAHNRALLFGDIVADRMVLNPAGQIVGDVCRRALGPPSSASEFIVMPNHVHGIVWIQREPIVEPGLTVGVEQLPDRSRSDEQHPPDSMTPDAAVAQPLPPDFAHIRRGLRDGLEPGSLITRVRTFKSAVTKRINRLHATPGAPVWQRGYHDRIIRDERELNAACQYILDNPRKWAEDKHNPTVLQEPP